MAKQAVWLSGLVSFEQAAEILEKIGQIQLSGSSVWRRTALWGERCKAVEAARRVTAQALPDQGEPVARASDHPGRMGVAMDGAMIPIRQEGWKELKVGCVFDIERRPTFDRQTGEWRDVAQAVHTSYGAHLGGPDVFGQVLWAEAQRRRWEQAGETIVLGDGAPWVWNLASEHFFGSREGVDWYHGSQHLAQAARLLHGEGTPAAQEWFQDHETLLFEGHAARIATELTQAATGKRKVAKQLRQEAGYFRENQGRMQYLELRDAGYPIGSGMVESGCKQFRARFTGPGMRWSRSGAERLLPVRAAIMSHRFDSLWQAAYAPPLN